jgi:hypothetical protein
LKDDEFERFGYFLRFRLHEPERAEVDRAFDLDVRPLLCRS